MAVAAVFDERRLQRRFDANDLREEDVSLERLSTGHLIVEILKFGPVDHHHPRFLAVAGIDEHAPRHGLAPET